jgi:hypothetical protein
LLSNAGAVTVALEAVVERLAFCATALRLSSSTGPKLLECDVVAVVSLAGELRLDSAVTPRALSM